MKYLKFSKVVFVILILLCLVNMITIGFFGYTTRRDIKRLNERITLVSEAHQDLLKKTGEFSQEYEEVKGLLAGGIIDTYEQLEEEVTTNYKQTQSIVSILENLNKRIMFIEEALW